MCNACRKSLTTTCHNFTKNETKLTVVNCFTILDNHDWFIRFLMKISRDCGQTFGDAKIFKFIMYVYCIVYTLSLKTMFAYNFWEDTSVSEYRIYLWFHAPLTQLKIRHFDFQLQWRSVIGSKLDFHALQPTLSSCPAGGDIKFCESFH